MNRILLLLLVKGTSEKEITPTIARSPMIWCVHSQAQSPLIKMSVTSLKSMMTCILLRQLLGKDKLQ
jgi:hypothetical protein